MKIAAENSIPATRSATSEHAVAPAFAPPAPRAALDPRWYQIAVLAGLLTTGLTRLGFDLGALQVAVTLGSVLLTQLACTRLARLPAFDARSALISGLSLCLLLRTDHVGIQAADQ